MLCLHDCITFSYFNYMSYFFFQIKKPQEYFLERATHWLTPRLPINVYYFTKPRKNRNFVSLAAPLSAHSTHSLKQKGFFP